MTVENDNFDNPILGFDEAGPAGGAPECTSIYCFNLSEAGVGGIQNGAIDVRDMGELQEKPVFRTRVEWYSGIAVYHGKSAGRLHGIKNAPIVV